MDNDVDLDLVVNNFDEAPSIFRNRLARGNCVKIALRGTQSNRYGIDSVVTMEAGELKQACYVTLARGFMGCDEPVVHFGLGDRDRIDKLTIRWRSGCVQTLAALEANRFYTIREPDVSPEVSTEIPAENTILSLDSVMFVRSERMDAWQVRHQEKDYDDFERQPLLPNKLSQLGPGIALGDVNGDGTTDLFVGGAAGQQASLIISRNGEYIPVKNELLGDGPFMNERRQNNCSD